MWDRFKGAVPHKLGGRSQQQQQQQQQNPRHDPGKNAFIGGGSYSYRVQGGPAPPRPPREFEQPLQQFYDDPTSVVEKVPTQDSHRNCAFRHSASSNRRPVSSVYSQPSPIHTSFAPASIVPLRQSHTFDDGDEISPPSSPEEITPRNGALPIPDISPIDEDDETYLGKMSQQESFAQSLRGNISTLRRQHRQKMDAANSQLRESKSRDRMRVQPPQPKPSELSKRGYHGGEVRWDPATGELTSSEKGRPSQVKPAEYAKEFGDSPPRAAAAAAPVSSTSTPLGDRVRRIAPPGFATGGAEKTLRAPATQTPRRQTPSPMSSPTTALDPAAGAFTADRPEWKGASGRSAIVKPVHDTKDVAPLKIPRKSVKMGLASPDAPSPAATDGLGGSTMVSPPASPHAPETQQSPRETIRQVAPSSPIPPPATPQQVKENNNTWATSNANYPSPPQSGAQKIAPEDTAATSLNSMHSQSPISTNPTSAVRRKLTPSQLSLHQQRSSISSTISQSDPYNYATYAATNPLPNANPSTYAMGTPGGWAHSSKSPDTAYDLAGVQQTLGEDYRDSGSPSRDGGVMDRRRPKRLDTWSGSTTPLSDEEPIKISLGGSQWANRDRKAPVLAAPNAKSSSRRDGDDYVRRGSMTGSIHKTLPPAPPETTATDRVDQLNAQLRGLANRRLNLTRCIKQMTELMPTDNIMASAEVLRKREVERKKVEALKMELAEVQREEYDLGIKLHRAYKRIDRSGDYEPTTLWVRRVTGC